MSVEERRLAGLLKQAVPAPPRELSAQEIMVTTNDRSSRSWMLPALSAGAILVVGVTIGVVATHHTGPSKTSFAPASSQSPATHTPTATPSTDARVVVPNVVGQTEAQATHVLQEAGFDVVIVAASARGGGHVPQGTVWSQNPPAGSTISKGATVTLDFQPAA
jgi:hypothetical protein